LSRLRLDSDAPLTRVRAVLAGAHSDFYHAARYARRRDLGS
jgi:hypothetical protein